MFCAVEKIIMPCAKKGRKSTPQSATRPGWRRNASHTEPQEHDGSWGSGAKRHTEYEFQEFALVLNFLCEHYVYGRLRPPARSRQKHWSAKTKQKFVAESAQKEKEIRITLSERFLSLPSSFCLANSESSYEFITRLKSQIAKGTKMLLFIIIFRIFILVGNHKPEWALKYTRRC